MRTALTICLALLMGLSIIAALHSCNPFAYMDTDEKFILKGTVER